MLEQDVHHALLSGDPQDQLVIAYNLIIDNKRISDETAKLHIRDFYFASDISVSQLFPYNSIACIFIILRIIARTKFTTWFQYLPQQILSVQAVQLQIFEFRFHARAHLHQGMAISDVVHTFISM